MSEKKGGLYNPIWLWEIAGARETEIMEHESAAITNHDLDQSYWSARLPLGMYWITSDVGRFLIDFRRKQIVG